MGKTRDLFRKIRKQKKIRDTKGTFHAKMGTIKDRKGKDLTEAKEIKKRWQEYQSGWPCPPPGNRSLVLPILWFSSISLHWSMRKAFSSLRAIFWNSAFRWVYLSFSPLPLASLLFSAICQASSEYFAFLHFFFLGMVLITASCTMSQTSTHSS